MEFESFLRKERENEEESKAGVLPPRSSLPRTVPALGEVNGGSLWLLNQPHVLNSRWSLLEVFRELVMQVFQDAKYCVQKSWVMRHRTLHKQHRRLHTHAMAGLLVPSLHLLPLGSLLSQCNNYGESLSKQQSKGNSLQAFHKSRRH